MRTRRSILAATTTVLLATITACAVAPAQPGGEPAEGGERDEERRSPGSSARMQASADGRAGVEVPGISASAEDDTGTVLPAELPQLNPGTDTCPGELVAVHHGSTVLQGSTTGMADDVSSWCGDTDPAQDTPDVTYQLSLQAAGSLSIRVSGTNGLVPAYQLRQAGCGTDGDDDYCIDAASGLSLISGHFPAGDYWLVIDGSNQTSGDFEVVIALGVPGCGDGILNPGEDCDRGDPNAAGDGCDALCQHEVLLDTDPDLCVAATPLALTMDVLVTVTGYTTGYTDDYAGSCSTTPGGRDRVYAITPAVSGTLKARIGETDCANPYANSCWDRVLYVREGACGAATDIACSDNPLDGAAPEQVAVQVLGGETYWLFVDGYDAGYYSDGTYTLDVRLTAPSP